MKRFYHYKTTLLFISLAMSLSILFGFSMARNVSIETPIRIEDFTSMTQDQLLTWSQEHDIKIETIEEYNDEIEVGKVISQNTIVGERLFAGSTVKVIVSKGPNPDVMVNLIDLKGKDIGEVQQFIETSKLLAATIEFEKSTEISSAFFIRMDTQATSIKRGQPIKFYISTGSKDELTTVVVPDFAEYTRQQISSWGQTNNIKTNFIEEFNNDIASGKVISQSQAPNSNVYDGSSITVRFSLGAGVVLENLVGKSKSTIDKFINDNGLKVNYTYTYSGTQNKDIGISMSPNASTKVGNGTTVNVTLSLGKISISDFKGKALSELQAWVNEVNKQGANLKVSSTQAYSDTTTSGLIITQTPSSGDINPGTEIKASISKGKGIVVDTYKGTTNTTVQTGLKLNKVEVYSDSPSGTVVDQNPSSGSTVDNGSTITLTVSIGKPTVSSFAGQSLANLQNQINTLNAKGAKLTLSKTADEYSSTVSKGNVITNTSGQVSVGTSISYTVSKGASITINNFVGGTALTQSGLNISVTYEYSDSVANGVVISQSRTAGTTVDSGTSMSLVVSKGAEPRITIPDLAGILGSRSSSVSQTQQIIGDYLRSIGISNISFQTGNYGIGTGLINNQTPPGGTSIKPTELVTVYISNN